MSSKTKKQKKQVITLSTLSALAMLADKKGSVLENATGDEICAFLKGAPTTIEVEYDEDCLPAGILEDNSDEEYEDVKTTIRINALNPKFAKHYIRYPITDDCKNLVVDLVDKTQLSAERNGLKTVAGLTNYPNLRRSLEREIEIKQLLCEVRTIQASGNGSKQVKTTYINDRKLHIEGDAEIGLMGNFVNTQANLVEVYTLNNPVRSWLLAGKGLARLGASSVGDKITDKCTPDAPYAAMAAYYGVINTEDTVKYRSFSRMKPKDYAIMLGKMMCPTMSSQVILDRTKWGNVDKEKDTLTRYDAMSLAVNNLGQKVYDAYQETKELAEDTELAGNLYFNDIGIGGEYDTAEVAAFFSMGAIKADENGDANLDDVLTMSKAIRNIFFVLESTTTLDIESTSYINVDEVE